MGRLRRRLEKCYILKSPRFIIDNRFPIILPPNYKLIEISEPNFKFTDGIKRDETKEKFKIFDAGKKYLLISKILIFQRF